MVAKNKKPYAGGFLLLPMAVLHSPKFRDLSGNGVKLLMDIGSQYNGKNNGDLCAAWKVMHKKGWKSETTLTRAKKELLDAGFIAETRKGHLPNFCGLYGITWQPLNPNPKLDVTPNGFPVGAWAELPKTGSGKNTPTTPETVVALRRIAPETGVGHNPIAPDSGAIGRERAVL